MIVSYRLCKTKFAASWFDGEGAYRFGGRWNSPGRRVFYTGESLALAALEMLVHLRNEQLLLSYSFATARFNEKLVLSVEDFSKLPKTWSHSPPPPLETQQIGDEWVKSNASAILKVPTAVLPISHNYVVNVKHPDFVKIELGTPELYVFDQRLKS